MPEEKLGPVDVADTGEPCRICGTVVRTEAMVGRNLYWCPTCQAA